MAWPGRCLAGVPNPLCGALEVKNAFAGYALETMIAYALERRANFTLYVAARANAVWLLAKRIKTSLCCPCQLKLRLRCELAPLGILYLLLEWDYARLRLLKGLHGVGHELNFVGAAH